MDFKQSCTIYKKVAPFLKSLIIYKKDEPE